MRTDHYSILGVTPAADHAAIRAAYRALMRRYHPDADSSSDAAGKASAINEAYAILGDPEKRARYDQALAANRPLQFDPAAHAEPDTRRRSWLAPLTAIGFAVVAVAMVVVAISPELANLQRTPVVAEEKEPSTEGVRAAAAGADRPPSNLCSEPAVSSLLKEELFRRAARLRPAAREQVELAAQLAVVRIGPPSEEMETGEDGCAGRVAIDLPRGLVVDGGRSNLNAEIGYHLARRADGALQVAGLSGAETVVRSLGTLGTEPRESARPDVVAAKEIASTGSARRPAELPVLAKAPSKSNPPAAAPRASGCNEVVDRAQRIVCEDGNLASLDRQLALLYAQSWTQADERRRAALLGTRQRFNERRHACSSADCIRTAYISRLREISDIMAGRPRQ